ncbi:hypothetical protein [Deinococcus sp. Leaf326]|uniref:hypothetical protein n=1 Tax=Deinococcus sp. Leaf326 TaxID=1736338 RepID=UPI0006FCEED3|nr:hypothetical protein [Deinococcus sp. Leaf326]KQR40749.1 hypothetical protein ASF71_00850 [Deinococcus sp. Leaf326]
MTQPVPEALKRVVMHEDPTQEAAATIAVDYSSRMDVAHLTLNPEHAPPESVDGYRIRASIQASLEGLRRYNRGITRRYGEWEGEQKLFQEGIEKAATEIEQLVHLAPRSPQQLIEALSALTDEQLLTVPGLGVKKLEYLRKGLV